MTRLARLQKILVREGIDALLVEEPLHLFYLTGLDCSSGKLLVEVSKVTLIVDGRYWEAARELSYPVLPLETFSLSAFVTERDFRSLGFEANRTLYTRFLELQEGLQHTNCSVKPLTSPVEELRMIKDLQEISSLQKAVALGMKGYEFVVSLLKNGVSEKWLATELEIFWKREGADRIGFEPIIAFGPNSSKPHHRPGNTVLEPNQPVLIDIGVVLDHYHSDMTRVVWWGEPKKELQQIFAIVQEAKERAVAICKPGVSIGELDRAARGFIASKGYGEQFVHNLGHGVGLEIHEAPFLRQKGPITEKLLEEGMVITIEPGIYLPGIGGVRLEDTFILCKAP